MSEPPEPETSETAWQATAGLAALVAGFGLAALAYEGVGPAALLSLPAALGAAATAVWHRQRWRRLEDEAESTRQAELVELVEAQAANARRLRRVEGIAELGLVAAQVGHELRNHLIASISTSSTAPRCCAEGTRRSSSTRCGPASSKAPSPMR